MKKTSKKSPTNRNPDLEIKHEIRNSDYDFECEDDYVVDGMNPQNEDKQVIAEVLFFQPKGLDDSHDRERFEKSYGEKYFKFSLLNQTFTPPEQCQKDIGHLRF